MITLSFGRIARVAKLADAIALEAIRRNPVGVQLSPRAPHHVLYFFIIYVGTKIR